MSTRLSIALTAFETLRSNPMHTFMSIIGLVIGVAALVGVLALGDGMERYAREQIDATTDLKIISVRARTTERVDGILVERSGAPVLDERDARSLQHAVGDSSTVVYYKRRAAGVSLPGDTLRTATYVAAAIETASELMRGELLAGRSLTRADLDQARPVVVLSTPVASRIIARPFGTNRRDSIRTASELLGRRVLVDSISAEVVGVIASSERDPIGALIPVSVPGAAHADDVAGIAVKADVVERVPAIRDRIRAWAEASLPRGADDIEIASNEMRVDQAQRAVRLFKVVMGLITGISVIVGGVGVMNVLLMAVTERTKEIGVRMATGARRKDIVFQFLIESISISTAGALAGLLTGLLSVFILTPIIRRITDVPFQAGFSWGSLLVVMAIAAVVGIVFGTYPAWRASRLNPVDAIRYE